MISSSFITSSVAPINVPINTTTTQLSTSPKNNNNNNNPKYLYASNLQTRKELAERVMSVMIKFVRTARFEFINYAKFATFCPVSNTYKVIQSNPKISKTTWKLSLQPKRIQDCLTVLKVILNLIVRDQTCTQRDLYYRQEDQFANNIQRCYRSIVDASLVLNVPRRCLRIHASPCGIFAGMVNTNDGLGMPENANAPRLITSQIAFSNQNLTLHSSIRHVLVVEKEAVFSRLLEDNFPSLYRCVLVTGKGRPDFATRVFVRSLCRNNENISVYALCDWNPSGVSIVLDYKLGTKTFVADPIPSCVPKLRWLGVHWHQFEEGRRCTALSPREITLASNLLSEEKNKFISTRPRWQTEIRHMHDRKLKCEIEALYPKDDEAIDFGREVYGMMSRRGWMD
jgi:meiotic recombination protein SPO11